MTESSRTFRLSVRTVIHMVAALAFLTAFPGYAQRIHAAGTHASGERPGGNLYSKPVLIHEPPEGALDLGPFQCETACKNNLRCVAWTYISPNSAIADGRCWLKGEITPLTKCPFCQSGTLALPDTDMPGGDYRHFSSLGEGLTAHRVTLAQCRAACLHDTRCQAWTWVKPAATPDTPATCWLKDRQPAPIRNGCCVSSYILTSPPPP